MLANVLSNMATPKYVTLSKFKNVLSEEEQAHLTDDSMTGSQDTAERNKDMAKDFLAYAESRVESYLTGYSLPLRRVPPSIEHAIYVLAAYMLFQRDDVSVSEEVDASYERVMNWLKSLQSGEAQLPRIDEDDEDFVGFGDKSTMVWDEFPYSDYDLSEANL
jgi:phage gp36-like protein